MMLPILISVSLAPVSYFFCASAPPLLAARRAKAAATAPARNWINGIRVSLCWLSASFLGSAAGFWRHSIPFGRPHQEKAPCDQLAGGLIWSRCNKALIARFAADDVAEQIPFVAL